MITVTIVTNMADVNGEEAIYIDGRLHTYQDTLFAVDIVTACKGKPVILRHLEIEAGDDELPGWPRLIDGVLPFVYEESP